MKSRGLRHQELGRLTGIGSTTLTRYRRTYQPGGLEGLKEVRFYRPESALQAYRGTLEAYFREHPPATAKEAMAKIDPLLGVRRRPDRVRLFLKRLGMDCRQVGMVPAKADLEQQAAFKKTPESPAWRRRRQDDVRCFLSMRRMLFWRRFGGCCGVLPGCLYLPRRDASDSMSWGR